MQRFRALIKVRVTDPHPRSLPRGIATALHPPDDIKGECQRVRGRGRLRRLWTVPDKGARRCSLGDWRSPRLGPFAALDRRAIMLEVGRRAPSGSCERLVREAHTEIAKSSFQRC